ncbi:aldose 1-epimerase family protein [Rhodococcus sp. NPDC057297]|uniref:aldose 1-epimerase family protein n=1 Tax=Rhodococcus sp. NPDC057297 TaxID=3346090 RepID=UPI0036356ECB
MVPTTPESQPPSSSGSRGATLTGSGWNVTVASVGAELVSVRTPSGRELLWDAGPQWRRHAPILFPCIGRSPADSVTVDGVVYPMPQHGFARDMAFTLVDTSDDTAEFELVSDDHTRRHYPFDFALRVRHRVRGSYLTSDYTIANTGSRSMPASFGLHTAFLWPTEPGARNSSTVVFAEDQADRVHRVVDGVPMPQSQPSPLAGRTLNLTDTLFDAGAVVFERVSGTEVRYRSEATGSLTLTWAGFEQFAVWSPPSGAGFVCLEPWAGLPALETSDGELGSRPASLAIPPGQDRAFSCTVKVDAEQPRQKNG